MILQELVSVEGVLSDRWRRVAVQQQWSGVFGGSKFACKYTGDSTGGRAHETL